MIKIIRDFTPMSDRYVYDFGKCSIEKGWAQVDTSQDASYFGQWVNPVERKIFAYIEGDLVLTQVDTDQELAAKFAEMKRWNEKQGHEFLGIDPGFNVPLKAALVSAGLEGYLH